jgi:hypothetical protein
VRVEVDIESTQQSPHASLGVLVKDFQRLAVIGLAKNTGKTTALVRILSELGQAGARAGVTSVGRDGEEHDVIDARIDKPLLDLPADTLVATTESLMRSSGLPFESLQRTAVRTPLGRVAVFRLLASGAVEVAGPSAAEDVRSVTDVMLEGGAEHVLIDGAIDRRAASSPAVAQGVVMSTGAVLDEDIEQVATHTHAAAELIGIGASEDSVLLGHATSTKESLLIDRDGEAIRLRPHLGLDGSETELAALLAGSQARALVLHGAVCEPVLEALARANRGRELEVVVQDSTKVFLSQHPPRWHRQRGVDLRALATIRLLAITVNPVAPRAHSFDSQRLRALIESGVPDIPVVDVLDPSYPIQTAA